MIYGGFNENTFDKSNPLLKIYFNAIIMQKFKDGWDEYHKI